MANITKRDPYKDVIRVERILHQEPRPQEEVIEGRKLLTLAEAQAQVDKKDKKTVDYPMFFGGVALKSTKTNVFYSGLTQSGKTSVMKVHLYEILCRIKDGSPEKLILFAPSSEFIPFVYAHVGDETPVYILNPSDARCYQWDLSKDLEGASNIQDVSHTLVKDKEGDTPFFTEGARSLLGAVIGAFYISVVKDGKVIGWTLKDVFNAMRTRNRIKAILGLQPEYLEDIGEAFLDRENQDVRSSFTARTQELKNVAAMWDGRARFSLKEFLDPAQRGGVLILGADANNRATMLELNRLILERAGKLIADREECEEARYWLFLDEFQKLGKTDILKELVTEGLKRGVRVHLASQNRANVVGVYGKEDAEVLYSECGSHYIFKHGIDETAEQAVKAIGRRKIRRWTRSNSVNVNKQDGRSVGSQDSFNSGSSTSSGSKETTTTNSTGHSVAFSQNHSTSSSLGVTMGRNESILEELAVSTGAIVNLEEGEFYCVTPAVQGFWKHKYRWEVLEPLVKAQSQRPEHAREIKREDAALSGFLKDWKDEELKRLKFSESTITLIRKGEADTRKRNKNDASDGEEQSLVNKLNKQFGQ